MRCVSTSVCEKSKKIENNREYGGLKRGFKFLSANGLFFDPFTFCGFLPIFLEEACTFIVRVRLEEAMLDFES